MRIHRDWDAAGWGLAPVAEATGPFCRRPLLEAWWRCRAPPEADLVLAESDHALLPLWQGPSGVAFLGEADLFDYHSPLGSGAAGLVAALAEQWAGTTPFVLDSLPEEAAGVIAAGFETAGVACTVEEHEAAAVLDLPGDFDAYLAGIGKKERHELRRKRRRFTAELGPWSLEGRRDDEALDVFFRMHRASSGDKGEFMTEAMAEFFAAALQVAGAGIDLLRDGDGNDVAAVFSFTEADAYYLYNSAYDSDYSGVSPGQVMLSVLIEAGIESGKSRFDFLKGDESYKYRLGARRRPLYAVRSVA